MVQLEPGHGAVDRRHVLLDGRHGALRPRGWCCSIEGASYSIESPVQARSPCWPTGHSPTRRRRAPLARDLLLVGDFNVPSVESEAFRVLEARGFRMKEALAGAFGTDLAQGKRYARIFAVPREDGAAFTRFSGRAGQSSMRAMRGRTRGFGLEQSSGSRSR
jgi:hypothetical protein